MWLSVNKIHGELSIHRFPSRHSQYRPKVIYFARDFVLLRGVLSVPHEVHGEMVGVRRVQRAAVVSSASTTKDVAGRSRTASANHSLFKHVYTRQSTVSQPHKYTNTTSNTRRPSIGAPPPCLNAGTYR